MTSFTKDNMTFRQFEDTWVIIYRDTMFKCVENGAKIHALMNALKDGKVECKLQYQSNGLSGFKLTFLFFDIIEHEITILFKWWMDKNNGNLLDVEQRIEIARENINKLELEKGKLLKQMKLFESSNEPA